MSDELMNPCRDCQDGQVWSGEKYVDCKRCCGTSYELTDAGKTLARLVVGEVSRLCAVIEAAQAEIAELSKAHEHQSSRAERWRDEAKEAQQERDAARAEIERLKDKMKPKTIVRPVFPISEDD